MVNGNNSQYNQENHSPNKNEKNIEEFSKRNNDLKKYSSQLKQLNMDDLENVQPTKTYKSQLNMDDLENVQPTKTYKSQLQKNNDNIPNEFYKKCEELKSIIPFKNIVDFVDNYIIKQALLLWYIALKYTDKYMNYINEHDKKLMLIFYENFGNKYAIHSQKFKEIYKLLK